MPSPGGWVAVGFGLFVVGLGFWVVGKGVRQHRTSSRIAETDRTPIRELRPGTAEVRGTTRPPDDADPVTAPIAGVDALVYDLEVKAKRGDNTHTIYEAHRSVPFVIDDGTGEVRVEPPDEGKVTLDTREIEVGPGEEPPPEVRRFVESIEDVDEAETMDIGPVTAGTRRRYREGILEPGEGAYVLGEAVETDSGWGRRRYVLTGGRAPEAFVLSDMSEEELVATERKSALLKVVGGILAMLFGGAFVVLPLLGFGS